MTFDDIQTWGTGWYQNLALIDFNSVQTNAVHRGQPQSHTVKHHLVYDFQTLYTVYFVDDANSAECD